MAVEAAVVEDANNEGGFNDMTNNQQKEEMFRQKQELKDCFLREEISAEDYTKQKDELERKLEELDTHTEKKQQKYRHEIVDGEDAGIDIWKYISAFLAFVLVAYVLTRLMRG